MGSRLCTAKDTLPPGKTLSGNQTLVSKNGFYELSLFTYYVMSNDHYLGIRPVNISDEVLWVANRGNPIRDPLTSELKISCTDNLVLIQSLELIWSTHLKRSDDTPSSIAVLLETGNLVLQEDALLQK
ncbi:G-type lectin S-receptor-like serine/threonine-protein kinase At2g19130 [Carex rostrata]